MTVSLRIVSEPGRVTLMLVGQTVAHGLPIIYALNMTPAEGEEALRKLAAAVWEAKRDAIEAPVASAM